MQNIPFVISKQDVKHSGAGSSAVYAHVVCSAEWLLIEV